MVVDAREVRIKAHRPRQKSAGFLVYRIARRLSLGFAEVETGNFAHCVAFRGQDRLAALVGRFNHMAERPSASVAARAEKEALERELSVARHLQRRLLSPADFACPGVGIAVDFAPAAAIGGDFYYLSYAERVLTVSVADVSGHGLPTGLVMAAAKASSACSLVPFCWDHRSLGCAAVRLDRGAASYDWINVARCLGAG